MIILLSSYSAAWLLIAALPISVYVAFSDVKSMKIPNIAVGALISGYAILGLMAFDFHTYLWQWSHLIVVLILGILLNAAGVIGAGDAKFAAASAPYVLLGDLGNLGWIFVVCVVVGFATHRVIKHSPLRKLVPDWQSWDSGRKFPMGLPLGLTLVSYLTLAAIGA